MKKYGNCMKRLVLQVVLFFAVLAVSVHADNVRAKKAVYIQDGSIILNGTINRENVDKIKHFYFDSLKDDMNYLVLQSTGGDLDDGIELAKFVVDNNIPVYVPNYCSSACTFAFFNAKEKDMHPDAIISIHNVSVQPTIDTIKYSSSEVQYVSQIVATNASTMMLRYAQAGIPIPVLLDASKKFGSNAIDLKRNDLVRYNILPKHAVFE